MPRRSPTKWSDLFQDEALKQLVAAALEHNFDLRIAAERVIEARAQFRIAGAERFPNLIAQASFTALAVVLASARTPSFRAASNHGRRATPRPASALDWELDFGAACGG